MQQLPILYSFVRCPYALRARISLAYSNIKCILREVDLRNKPPELLKISPKGTVPVLQLPTGQIIEQSLEIIYYSLMQNDPLGINNLNAKDRKTVDELIEKNDTTFVPLLNKYKYFDRYPEDTQASYREQIECHFLRQMDTQLELSPYLLGQKVSAADIAVFPFIRQFALVDPDWFFASNYRFLIIWLERFIKNPSFEMIMQKNLPWAPNSPEVIFPASLYNLS
jgi:glutathione S-transferase